MAQPTAQPPMAQHRPQFNPPNQQRDFAMPNGRPNTFNATSPQPTMNYSTPSPQQYAPQFNQGPPQKRPRLSPDVTSPFSTSSPVFSPNGIPQASNSGPGTSFNTMAAQSSRPGLMAPPQKPPEKSNEDRSYDDILAGTGINIEEEERNLNRPEYLSQGAQSFQSTTGSFGSTPANSFSQVSGVAGGTSNATQESQISNDEKLRRDHERADWEAARHSQHALWDMFLYGGTLNEKIKRFSGNEHLVEAQAGVLVNTQRNAPPPVVRVNGLEGASKVIDQGQSILDTKDKAERLSDIMKLVSLAARNRLAGVLNSAARLSNERRQHSKGMVPDDWTDIGIQQRATDEGVQDAQSPAGSTSLKRTHSQANNDTLQQPLQHPALEIFDRSANNSRSAEEARLARRQRRKAKASEDRDVTDLDSADAALAAVLDPDKKTTKKERKATETKFAEQQQHKNANEAARLATSSMIGRTFGKKGKSYSWMTGGSGGAASAASTPGRGVTSSVVTPGPATPGAVRIPLVSRGRRFKGWDEDIDKGVTPKDILLILEHDAQAARSYIKGYSTIDGKEA